jgi:acyl-CoA synthetase (AMP-forming)/AMP-acid ligase II
MTLLDIFESEVRLSPGAASFIQEDGKSFSYSQLDDIATYLGKELACAIKVAPVDEGRDETPLVAVMMTRGVGLVAAILGILKAGAGNNQNTCSH